MAGNIYAGCWVEQMANGKWAICWPDTTYLETNIGSKGWGTRKLREYTKSQSSSQG